MAGSDVVVLDPSAKAALHTTGSVAVDMESHVAAEFAASRNLPFGVVRVICDFCHPHVAAAGAECPGAQGQVDIAGVLRSIAGDPGQLVTLVGSRPRFRGRGDGRYAAVAGFLDLASVLMRASSVSTCFGEHEFGRTLVLERISGAIGPVVRGPRNAAISDLIGCAMESAAAVGS